MNNFVENVNILYEKVAKIVVTGGPCAGKSKILKKIPEDLKKLGWITLVVPETANELITGGVAPWTCISNKRYHELQLELQVKKESLFERAAVDMIVSHLAEKVIILCDRGLLDPLAYMNSDEFSDIASREMYDNAFNYDAVFHLSTVATLDPDLYTTEDSTSRHETADEAISLDDKTYHAWDAFDEVRFKLPARTRFEDRYEEFLYLLRGFLEINFRK